MDRLARGDTKGLTKAQLDKAIRPNAERQQAAREFLAADRQARKELFAVQLSPEEIAKNARGLLALKEQRKQLR